MPAISRKNKKRAGKVIAVKEAKSDEATVVSGQLQKKIGNKKRKPRNERGLVFIKNLPKGFEEEQLKGYFSQFGHITNLRLVRSRRTGNSKGFAYIQFQIPEVAKIAAETMDNYLMFQKIVKATYIPPEEQKYNYFRSTVKCVQNSAGRPIFVSSKTKQINNCANAYNNWDDETYKKRTKIALKKFQKLKKRHADLGIDFDKFVLKPSFSEDSGEDTSQNDNGHNFNAGNLLLVKNQEISPESESQKTAKKTPKRLKKNNLLLRQPLQEDVSDEDSTPAKITLPEIKLQNLKKKQKKTEKSKDLNLLSILGQSLQEDDSEDEDFVPADVSEINVSSSEPEMAEEDLPIETSESEEGKATITKKEKDALKRKMDVFEKITKRKNGGIQKTARRQKFKAPAVKKFSEKAKLKSDAVKEIIKNEKVKIFSKKDLKKTKKKV